MTYVKWLAARTECQPESKVRRLVGTRLGAFNIGSLVASGHTPQTVAEWYPEISEEDATHCAEYFASLVGDLKDGHE